ncbi:MAG: hypothetical protein HAW67_02605 [Endozoicomonadaceae bacterium]|nr:hypothetical protein [Endozoicomonadaceae bacterium]
MFRSLIIFLFITLFCLESHAAVSDDACGMTSVEGGQIVKSGSPTICEDDLAFQVHNIQYSKIMNDPFWNGLASLFVSDDVLNSEFNSFVARKLNISSILYSILKGAAQLGMIAFYSILILKVGQIGYLIKKTGQFKISDEKSDLVKFTLYFFMLVILMVPVGGIVFGQGLFTIGTLPAIMGGNFFTSTYLSQLSLQSTEVKVEKNQAFLDAQSFSSELIGIASCERRTRQMLFAFNAKKGKWVNDNYATDLVGASDNQEDVHKKYQKCLSYIGVPTLLPEGVGIKNIAFNKRSGYDRLCYKSISVYDHYAYGFNHSCGNVSYSYPTNYSEVDDWDIDEELEEIQTNFNAKKYYQLFKSKESEVSQLLLSSLDDEEKQLKLIEIYENWAKTILQPELRGNALLNNDTKAKISVKFTYALNSLLGGSVVDDGALIDMRKDGLGDNAFSLYYGVDYQENDYYFGIDWLKVDAYRAADDIQTYNCILNWENYADLRKFIIEYNRAEEDDTSEMLTDSIQQHECSRAVHKSKRDSGNDTDNSRYFEFLAQGGLLADADVLNENGVLRSISLDETQRNAFRINESKDQLSKTRYLDALTKKALIEGYVYAVKVAISNAMSDSLLDEAAQDEVLPVARAKGFAALGSVLMLTTKNEGGGSHFKDLIQRSLSAHSEGDPSLHINLKAFGSTEKGIAKKKEARSLFTPIDSGSLFKMGGIDTTPAFQGDYFGAQADEEAAYRSFLGWVEGKLFSPVDHIKKASGIPSSMALIDGLKSCSDGNAEHCVSSASHPTVALMRFGHDLMNNMLVLAIADLVVNKLSSLAKNSKKSGEVCDGDGWGTEACGTQLKKDKANVFKRAGGAISKFVTGGVLKILKVVLDTAAMALQLMRPFIWGMFTVGVFFAYVVPMMSFLLSISIYILWVAAGFAAKVVLPFYCALKLKDIEFSYKNGFNEFYEEFIGQFFKPIFLTISVIFSWTFVWIGLFVANTVFGLIFEGISPYNGATFTGIIMKLMVYIVYFVVIFVLIKVGLDMIKTLTGNFERLMKFKGGKDEQFLQSLGFEQFVQTSIMRQVAQAPLVAIQKFMGNKNQDKAIKDNMNAINALVRAYENDPEGFDAAHHKMQDGGKE